MINPKTADKILDEFKKAKNILLALHVSPDGDSFSSVLSLDLVLRAMKKKTRIISYSAWNKKYNSLPGIENIEIADFAKIDLSGFDLFIALDSVKWGMITRNKIPEKFPHGLKIINIDHHISNEKMGDINLISPESSTAEVLYHLFKIWRRPIDEKLANLLFFGIVSDSGCFQYFQYVSRETFAVADDLMSKGASLAEAVTRGFRSFDFITLKYWGKILENMQRDESGKFIWATFSKKDKESTGVDITGIEGAANMFACIIEDTEFGIIINEEKENLIRGSLRARADFDVSKMAQELGGGGHKQAAGFSLKMSLPEAEKKVLATARKYLKIN